MTPVSIRRRCARLQVQHNFQAQQLEQTDGVDEEKARPVRRDCPGPHIRPTVQHFDSDVAVGSLKPRHRPEILVQPHEPLLHHHRTRKEMSAFVQHVLLETLWCAEQSIERPL